MSFSIYLSSRDHTSFLAIFKIKSWLFYVGIVGYFAISTETDNPNVLFNYTTIFTPGMSHAKLMFCLFNDTFGTHISLTQLKDP